MQRITRDIFDQITLNASLQRLGIVELEERLEFSPLPLDLCCECKFQPDDPWRDIRLGDPATDGMGTTGTTSGWPL